MCFVNSAANVKEIYCGLYFLYHTSLLFGLLFLFLFCIVYKKHFILMLSNKDQIDTLFFEWVTYEHFIRVEPQSI